MGRWVAIGVWCGFVGARSCGTGRSVLVPDSNSAEAEDHHSLRLDNHRLLQFGPSCDGTRSGMSPHPLIINKSFVRRLWIVLDPAPLGTALSVVTTAVAVA